LKIGVDDLHRKRGDALSGSRMPLLSGLKYRIMIASAIGISIMATIIIIRITKPEHMKGSEIFSSTTYLSEDSNKNE